MKRAWVVIAATVVGLASMMNFHTKPVTSSIVTMPPTSATTVRKSINDPTITAPDGTTGSVPKSSTGAMTATPPIARTVAGSLVDDSYGTLSVSVTGSGTHVSNVSLAAINEDGDPQTASIDRYSIPLLEREAMSAQSAKIHSVSGASYTSAGFKQSLQAALIELRRTALDRSPSKAGATSPSTVPLAHAPTGDGGDGGNNDN
jgi:hypothetical protein